jgi:hypothetical protein
MDPQCNISTLRTTAWQSIHRSQCRLNVRIHIREARHCAIVVILQTLHVFSQRWPLVWPATLRPPPLISPAVNRQQVGFHPECS